MEKGEEKEVKKGICLLMKAVQKIFVLIINLLGTIWQQRGTLFSQVGWRTLIYLFIPTYLEYILGHGLHPPILKINTV